MNVAYPVKVGHYFFYAAYPESGRPQTQYVYVFTGETAQLNCSIRPGRAITLYSAQWSRNNRRIIDNAFSLMVLVQNVSQNGTIYQCDVAVQSCSPISHCPTGNNWIAEGDFITLVVGGECILYCKSNLTNIGILGTLLQGKCDSKCLVKDLKYLTHLCLLKISFWRGFLYSAPRPN